LISRNGISSARPWRSRPGSVPSCATARPVGPTRWARTSRRRRRGGSPSHSELYAPLRCNEARGRACMVAVFGRNQHILTVTCAAGIAIALRVSLVPVTALGYKSLGSTPCYTRPAASKRRASRRWPRDGEGGIHRFAPSPHTTHVCPEKCVQHGYLVVSGFGRTSDSCVRARPPVPLRALSQQTPSAPLSDGRARASASNRCAVRPRAAGCWFKSA
jgi:hypothetical protein